MIPAVLVAAAIVTFGSMIAPGAVGRSERVRSVGHRRAGQAAARLEVVVRWLRSVRGRRNTSCSPEAVASWCDALARSVRSGSTLRAAVSASRPDDPIVQEATAGLRLSLDRGIALAVVMRVESTRSPDRHLDAARDVIGVVAELGGSSAAPLDRVATALRMRAADDRERVTQAAQARMSSKVLTLVPIGVLGVLILTDPAVWRVVTAPLGVTCVVAGLALNLVGNRWMHRMIGGAR